MKHFIQYTFISVLFLLLSCSEEKLSDTGFGVVKGRVVKENTFEPIANARISSNPNSSVVFTDANGYFTINEVPSNSYSFEARKEGYIAKFEAVTVAINSISEIIFELKVSTSGNVPPTIPVLTSPVDNSINQELSLNLTWTTTDTNLDPITAKILLRNDVTDVVQTFDNITTATFAVSNLNYSTKYFWQVVVNDGINSPVYSPISSFRTKIFPDARFLYSRRIYLSIYSILIIVKS